MGADGGKRLFRQFAGQQLRALQAMTLRRFGGGRIVQIMQQAGQAPERLIFAETARQSAHDSLSGQRVLQKRCGRALIRQQFQGLISFEHFQFPLRRDCKTGEQLWQGGTHLLFPAGQKRRLG